MCRPRRLAPFDPPRYRPGKPPPPIPRRTDRCRPAGPPLSAFSRARERAADGFAIAATDDAASGAAAFTRLRERNLAEDEQPKWMEVLFSSHPSLRSRIERLEASA